MGAQTALTLIPPTTPSLFDYAALDRATEAELRADAAIIKGLLRRTAEDLIEIGTKLNHGKDLLPHGMFLPWIAAEFDDMGETTAWKMMHVAEVYGKSPLGKLLKPSALYELAAPSTPLEVRIEIEKRIDAGELVTAADIRELKADYAEVVQFASEKTAQLTAAEQSNLDLVANAHRLATEESEKKHGAEIEGLKQRVDALQAAAAVSIAATPATTDANVVAFVPKDDGAGVTDPDPLTTVDGDNPDTVDIADSTFGAHAIHTALSTIDLAQTTPSDFWAIFNPPFLKPKTTLWLNAALKTLKAIKKDMPK
jgi:hypothetical protein